MMENRTMHRTSAARESFAKDARIAELEAKLESAFDHMETMNQLWNWHHIHRNDEADFINIQKFLAKNGRNAQRCEF